ncbi:MAG: polysaccharide biosynthesis C-terminal domain-containing protein [Holophagales bacterium]|nr:polysaccharide biosynthesis C-terminal domain-containing protein [Holophagales bacterium]
MPPGPGARRAILVSTVSVLAGGGVALVGSLVLRVLMARALEPSALGLVLLAIAIVTPVGSIAGLGTNPAVAQGVAERRARGDEEGARGLARRAQLLALAAGVLAAALLAALAGPLAVLLGQPGLDGVLLPMAPVALGLAAGVAALGVSRGFGDSLGRALFRDTGGGVLRVLGVGAAFLAAEPTSFGVAAGFAAGSLSAELLFVGYVAAKGWLSAGSRTPTRSLLPVLRPYAATEVLSQAALWLDIVVLGALAPPVVVGLYGIARGLTRVLDLVRQASSHGYLPSASAAVARGEGDRIATLHVSTRRFAFALVWPFLAVCLLAPAPLLGLLFGPAYEAAAPALRLLALASLLSSFFDYLDLVLVAERRPGDVLRAGIAGNAALVALLAALVPAWGGEGAALALLGSSLLRGLLLHRFVFRSRSFRPFLPAVTGPALLAAASLGVGAAALQVLRPAPLASLLLAATTGGAAAAIALLTFFRKRSGGADALTGSGTDVGSSPP